MTSDLRHSAAGKLTSNLRSQASDLRPLTSERLSSDLRDPSSELTSDLRPPTSAASPPKAMLAICSDLDETPDAETYFEQIRFLNTTEKTSMGYGVGLNVGNTIYFDMPPGHFSYWNTSEKNREIIREYIKRGWIDCLHSYGDLATTRAHAGRALDELAKHDCWLKVWVDHAVAPTNFGSDIMQGHGDEPGHPAYHADLTVQYGIKNVWRGRVTSVIGQARAPTLKGIFSSAHPVASVRTCGKELAKHLLARCGSPKYRTHSDNRLFYSCELRDGRRTLEFVRCNPHWQGVSGADRGDRIHEVLTHRFLDTFSARGGFCVLYTHLGKLSKNCPRQFSPPVQDALRLLAEYHCAGRISVIRTSELLEYARVSNAFSS